MAQQDVNDSDLNPRTAQGESANSGFETAAEFLDFIKYYCWIQYHRLCVLRKLRQFQDDLKR
jgi:hypothetical protein